MILTKGGLKSKRKRIKYVALTIWTKFKEQNFYGFDLKTEAGLFQLYHQYKVWCEDKNIETKPFNELEPQYKDN